MFLYFWRGKVIHQLVTKCDWALFCASADSCFFKNQNQNPNQNRGQLSFSGGRLGIWGHIQGKYKSGPHCVQSNSYLSFMLIWKEPDCQDAVKLSEWKEINKINSAKRSLST